MIGRARWAAVAVAVLALAVAAIVARSQPTHPFSRLAPATAASAANAVTPPPVSLSPHSGTPTAAPPHDSKSNFPPWLGSLLLALLAAGAVLALGRFTRGRWGFAFTDRRARRPGHATEVPAADAPAPAELTDAVRLGIADIEHGPVSDAIVACWVRVETAAHNAGLAARASETSTEFVDRVLGTFGARERSLRRLSALYREARFSEHVMSEASRSDARECLREISDDLGGAREKA